MKTRILTIPLFLISFIAAATPINHITYHKKNIILNDKTLYVNAKLDTASLGQYAFKTLQDAVAYAKGGTEQQPSIIYLEPDVYWTDNPNDDNAENKLIGLQMDQANLTLIGLSDNADHTIIAGNRGQMAGAVGNWNTIGVGDGFHAYNITFGNYCNVDLVYPLNPAKNYAKRQETVTQAQVITKAHSGDMDKWLFENCKFISYLNVFARSNEPHRAYYLNCFFQCTDDAIGTGDINVFQRCTFHFYANHPSGSASNIIQVYLGCQFKSVLRDPAANSTIFFAKQNDTFALIDGVFTGNATQLEWTDEPSDNARHYVHNNILNGKPAFVSPSKPQLSVNLDAQALKAFKIGAVYNIYNLLRGDDDWDPAGQKTQLAPYGNLPYRLKLSSNKIQLNAEKNESTLVSYSLYPTRVSTPVKWQVSDEKILTIVRHPNQSITVTGHNQTDHTLRAFIKAETPEKIQSVLYMDVLPVPLPAPKIIKQVQIGTPMKDSIRLNYTLNIKNKADHSLIDWYRATLPDGTDTLPVAITRLNEPLKTYPLSTGDIGYYLVARIQPAYQSSLRGVPVMVVSRKITADDLSTKNITTTFKNISVQRSKMMRNGFWNLDTHRPIDLPAKFDWIAAEGDAWTYRLGEGAASGRYGLTPVKRGARLLYPQAGTFGGMTVALDLSPNKAAGQGFGSATGQYLDVYIKYDVQSQTGYGLRIERTPAYGNGVRFMLYRFEHGVGTPIGKEFYSSAFLPGCHIRLKVEGTTLTAQVTTSSNQQEGQKESGLLHELNMSETIGPNSYGGFGLQYTGTVYSSGIIFEKFDVSYSK